MVQILNSGGAFAWTKLRQYKLPFLRYCRFVISDTLGMAATSWLLTTKSGVLCGALEVYLHTKKQKNPALFYYDIANLLIWVLWTCLNKFTKNCGINSDQFRALLVAYLHPKKWRKSNKPLLRNCRFVILCTLGMSNQTHHKR